MAFVLSAQLNLLPPNNVAIIAGQIRRQLNLVSTIGLNVSAPKNIGAIVSQVNSALKSINTNVRVNVHAKGMASTTKSIKDAAVATKSLHRGVEQLGYESAKSIRHYSAFALITSSVIKLTAAFSAGIGKAIKYDREMVRIAQVTGQSLESLKGLSTEVTRLSTTFGLSSEDILESAVTLSQAGLSAKNTKIALEALAKTGLSATFGNIKGTTEAAIAIMQQFGLQATELEGILGSVNAVSAAFAVESEDIAVAVRLSGGALRAAGVNFHEFESLLTSVRQTTRESAESIAAGFRTIFARLQRSRTQNFLKDLGIDVLNDDGLFAGGYEAIRRISTALEGMPTVDPRFSQVVEELGGFRQVSKVIPLLEQFKVSEKALSVSLRGSASLTQDAVVAQQSLEVQFNKTREAFLALIRDIVTEDSFKDTIKTVLSLANAFISVADSIKSIIPYIGILSAVNFIPKISSYTSGFRKGLNNEKVTGYASGGLIPGAGDGDTVPALLTPGEFVIKKSSARKIGYDALSKMNAGGYGIRKFNTGGTVPPTPRQYSVFQSDPHSTMGSPDKLNLGIVTLGVAMFGLSEVVDRAFGSDSPISQLTKAALGLFGAFTVYTSVFKKVGQTVSDSKAIYPFTSIKKTNDGINADSVLNTDKAFLARIDSKKKEIKGNADSNIKSMIKNEMSSLKSDELANAVRNSNRVSEIKKNKFADSIDSSSSNYNSKARGDYITQQNALGNKISINQSTKDLREKEIDIRTQRAINKQMRRNPNANIDAQAIRGNISNLVNSQNTIFSDEDLISSYGQSTYQDNMNKSRARINSRTNIRRRRRTATNNIKNSGGVTQVLGAMNAEQDQIIPDLTPEAEQRAKNLRRRASLLNKRRIARTSYAAAGIAAASTIGGSYLASIGEEKLNTGDASGRNAYTQGNAISLGGSGAAAGMQAGAAFGPQGAIIGAALGGIGGYLYGLAKASTEADKILRTVKLDKDLEKLSGKFAQVTSGVSTNSDIKGSVLGVINEQFSSISKLSGTERSDSIAKIKGQTSEIEEFYKSIARDSSSLDEFNRATNNSLIQFAAISGIDFKELIVSVDKTIKSEAKAKEALDRMSQAARTNIDFQDMLNAFSTALALASRSLESFDSNLDRIEANTNFSGASRKSSDAGGIFKSAASGRFADFNAITSTTSNLLSPFGTVGTKIANNVSDVATARQLMPEIIKEFANNPLSGDKTPQELAQRRLGDAGISQDVITQVLAGITNAIGDESNQSNLAKKFRANPNDTANDIFKSITPFIEVMGEFAGKVSEHNTRIGRLFKLSSDIQAKINTLKLEEADKLTNLYLKFAEDAGNPMSISNSAVIDSIRVSEISGASSNVNTLYNDASNAQNNIKYLDELISSMELSGLAVDNELRARQFNIDVLTKSSEALQELTKNGYEYAAVERELANAGGERRFRRDALVNQAFGSSESKLNEAKTISAVSALYNGQLELSQLNDTGKDSVLKFLEQNSEVRFAGLGNEQGKDILGKLLIKDQAAKIQRFEGLSPVDAELKARDNVKQGLISTNTEDALRAKLVEVVTAQGLASTALQKLLEGQDPLRTDLLLQENNRFLGELQTILNTSLINQENSKIDRANETIQLGNNARGLPRVEDIQNAMSRGQLEEDLRNIQKENKISTEGSLKKLEETSRVLKDPKFTQVGMVQGVRMTNITSEGKDKLKELGTTLGLNPNEVSQIATQSSNPDIAIEAMREKFRINNNKTTTDLATPIARQLEALRPIAPQLRGKTPTELQDMLDLKKSAPSQFEMNRAINDRDAAEETKRQISNDTLTSMNNSVNGLNKFANNFQGNVDKLNGMNMSLDGNHRVEVIFNGAEVLTQITPSIETLVSTKVRDAINNFADRNFPNAERVS